MTIGICFDSPYPVVRQALFAKSVSAWRAWWFACVAAMTLLAYGAAGNAQNSARPSSIDPLLLDSFAIGSGDGATCRVQSELAHYAITGIFDRSWTIICRDAAQSVGQIFALRGDDAVARIQARPASIQCGPATGAQEEIIECRDGTGTLPARRRIVRRGNTTFVGEGLAAYDDAVRIAMASIMEQRIVTGKIDVATTSIGDEQAMARIQVAHLPADRALAEGYRRNNSGDFAEAAVFFEALQRRPASESLGVDPNEFSLNRALQLSNLGDFGEAERLFASVDAQPTADIVQLRLRRNFRAMHMLNQRDYAGAIGALNQTLATIPLLQLSADGDVNISLALAAGLNSDTNGRVLSQVSGEERLTPLERAIVIDAQADQLRGSIYRLQGNFAGARKHDALTRALAQSITVRDGRVTSIIRLQAQILGEVAAVDEAAGLPLDAEARYRDAIALLEREYPETSALSASRARIASFYARQGRSDEALVSYRQVIAALNQAHRQLSGVYNQMAPYYRLLVDRQATDPAAMAEFFTAVQLLTRPGVADTQAQLARELSSGGGESATLFRRANNLARDLERSRIDLARLSGLSDSPEVAAQRLATQAQIDAQAAEQTRTLAQLAQFPQYRAVSQDALPLNELQASLGPNEGYAKLSIIGEDVFALFVTRGRALAWRTAINRAELDASVDQIRNSISVQEAGQYTTYPYDAEAAHKLYLDLFAPVTAQMATVRHVIFEPDGAMLRLPLNLLITDAASVTAYRARADAPGGDPFDMRGIAWLGSRNRVSTAVSPLAFRNTRAAPASRASRAYLGFGNNLPVSDVTTVAAVRGSTGADGVGCDWPLAEWNQPISATELYNARDMIGAGRSEVVTGAAFTDRSLLQREDLSNYRILHFATHGLVTAPRVGCPARPALLTSFGTENSDGLLSFDEIFGLRLDADLVILSACDTAGEASISATRAAGITTGGGSALDGLVRAFIGAGGRTVLASHWPAPDDFDATQRLIGGIFQAGPDQSIAEALGAAQDRMMADAETSHPYYWAGFAIIGDGATAMFRSADTASAPAATTILARSGR